MGMGRRRARKSPDHPRTEEPTTDRRTKTEGKKAVRDEGAGEGGREGARLTAIAVASLAPRGNIEREGGAAVTEARRRRKLLLLPGAHSPSSEERKSGMCCNARRRRAGEQPVSSRRQSVAVAVGRLFGRSVAPIERGRSLSQRGAAGQRRGRPPNNERSPFLPSLPSSHGLR